MDKQEIAMTNLWTIHHANDTSAAGCEHVKDWLRAHNWSANPEFMARIHEPEHDAEPLVLLVKTEKETVGGLFSLRERLPCSGWLHP